MTTRTSYPASKNNAQVVVHRLLDSVIDAFDPRADFDCTAPNCPECGNKALRESRTETQITYGCPACGQDYSEKQLLESAGEEYDVDTDPENVKDMVLYGTYELPGPRICIYFEIKPIKSDYPDEVVSCGWDSTVPITLTEQDVEQGTSIADKAYSFLANNGAREVYSGKTSLRFSTGFNFEHEYGTDVRHTYHLVDFTAEQKAAVLELYLADDVKSHTNDVIESAGEEYDVDTDPENVKDTVLSAPDNIPRICVYCGIVTPDSGEDEGGWVNEEGFPIVLTKQDIERGSSIVIDAYYFITRNFGGAVRASRVYGDIGNAYHTEYRPFGYDPNKKIQYTFVLKGFTPEQEKEVWDLFHSEGVAMESVTPKDVEYDVDTDPENVKDMVLSQPDLNPRIRVSYTCTTPESAEVGEHSETGWVDEEGAAMTPDEFDIEEGRDAVYNAYTFLVGEGADIPSSSQFHVGVWYSTGDEIQDNATGETTERSYHLTDFTPEQEEQVWDLLQDRRLRQARNYRLRESNTLDTSGAPSDEEYDPDTDPENVKDMVLSQPDLNPRIRVSYTCITPESAEVGDHSETGWEDEEGISMTPDEFDIEDGKDVCDKAYDYLVVNAYHTSSSRFHVGVWYSSGYVTRSYATGEEIEYDYHLTDFTPEQEKKVWDMLHSEGVAMESVTPKDVEYDVDTDPETVKDFVLSAPDSDEPRISVYCEIVTPESDEDEEVVEGSWVNKEGFPIALTKRDIERGSSIATKAYYFIVRNFGGAVEAVRSRGDVGAFYCTELRPYGDDPNKKIQYTFTLKGFTPQQERVVWDLFNSQI